MTERSIGCAQATHCDGHCVHRCRWRWVGACSVFGSSTLVPSMEVISTITFSLVESFGRDPWAHRVAIWSYLSCSLAIRQWPGNCGSVYGCRTDHRTTITISASKPAGSYRWTRHLFSLTKAGAFWLGILPSATSDLSFRYIMWRRMESEREGSERRVGRVARVSPRRTPRRLARVMGRRGRNKIAPLMPGLVAPEPPGTLTEPPGTLTEPTVPLDPFTPEARVLIRLRILLGRELRNQSLDLPRPMWEVLSRLANYEPEAVRLLSDYMSNAGVPSSESESYAAVVPTSSPSSSATGNYFYANEAVAVTARVCVRELLLSADAAPALPIEGVLAALPAHVRGALRRVGLDLHEVLASAPAFCTFEAGYGISYVYLAPTWLTTVAEEEEGWCDRSEVDGWGVRVDRQSCF
jgi:hypothetical protein